MYLRPQLASLFVSILAGAILTAPLRCSAQSSPTPALPEKVIIDTDIGDDIDDAFAIALALRSPELQILGISATFGDTETRAKLLDRFLAEVGHTEIPVAAGASSKPKGTFTQRRYAEGGHSSKSSHPDAATFLLDQIRRYPGQITLIAIGPLMNIGAAIDKDPATFRKLKRIIIMGGCIKRGYGDLGFGPPQPAQPEWNILNDIPSAQKLFAAGVPLFVMPLDSTQLKMDEVKRAFLFRQGTPLTDALTLLYHQWGQETPTLFDPMTIAFAVNPSLCPVQPMRIRVDDEGFTRSDPGSPNAQVCLESNPDAFFRFYLNRVAVQYARLVCVAVALSPVLCSTARSRQNENDSLDNILPHGRWSMRIRTGPRERGWSRGPDPRDRRTSAGLLSPGNRRTNALPEGVRREQSPGGGLHL